MELAVIYPVYNEAEIIRDTTEKTIEHLEGSDVESFTVAFITDGSTDGTQDIADKIAEANSSVKHLAYSERLGKGKAFEKGFEEIEADKYIYSDADLSADLENIEDLLSILDEGYEIAVGSRREEGGFERGIGREIPSLVFNSLLRITFNSRIKDHQCGFKGFCSDRLTDLFRDVESNHWFWDAEMLVRAQRKELKIKEFSVTWSEEKDSKVNVFRDSIYFLRKILELKIKLLKEGRSRNEGS